MGRFFDYENGFMQTLGKICDCICLDLMWLVCCIPIFTIGAASTAYYYAYNKVIRQRRSYVFREFVSGFKTNFKLATGNWLLVMLLYLITFADCYILRSLMGTMKGAPVILAIMLAIILFLTMWVIYLFPYIARFENTGRAARKNCVIIMLANAPWTILLLVLFVLTLVLFLLIPGLGFFVPILYVVLSNLILERIFRKYMRPEDLEAEKEIDMNK